MTIQRIVDIDLTGDEFKSELRALPLFTVLQAVFDDLPDGMPVGLDRWAIAYPEQFFQLLVRIERTAAALRAEQRTALAAIEASRRCQGCGRDTGKSLWPFCSSECLLTSTNPGVS